MDLFEKILKDKGPLGSLSHIDDNYYMFPMLEGEIGPRMRFKGNDVLNWSLNNYLGLANNPEVRKADADAAKDWGLSYPMGARMIVRTGESERQRSFELAHAVAAGGVRQGRGGGGAASADRAKQQAALQLRGPRGQLPRALSTQTARSILWSSLLRLR